MSNLLTLSERRKRKVVDYWPARGLKYELEPLEDIAARMAPYDPDAAPHESGVYFLFDGAGALQYVGMAVSIYNRLHQHMYPAGPHNPPADWWSRAAWCEIDVPHRHQLHRIEVAYIREYKPPRNIRQK